MRIFFFTLIFISGAQLLAQNGTLKGIISDNENEPIPFANVALLKDGSTILGTTSDFDGFYFLDSIQVGKYDLQISYVGFQTLLLKDITVLENAILTNDITLEKGIIISCGWGCFFWWEKPLFEKDNTTTETIYTRSEINHLPY